VEEFGPAARAERFLVALPTVLGLVHLRQIFVRRCHIHSTFLSGLLVTDWAMVTDRAMEAWYHPSIA